MGDTKKPTTPENEVNYEDDIAEADDLEARLNALAEESEDSLKPKSAIANEDKWASLDEVEEAEATAMMNDGSEDTWF